MRAGHIVALRLAGGRGFDVVEGLVKLDMGMGWRQKRRTAEPSSGGSKKLISASTGPLGASRGAGVVTGAVAVAWAGSGWSWWAGAGAEAVAADML